jgi:hypothetical protein
MIMVIHLINGKTIRHPIEKNICANIEAIFESYLDSKGEKLVFDRIIVICSNITHITFEKNKIDIPEYGMV